MDFVTDQAILSLDGKVFEAFVGQGVVQWRMHVDYLAVEVKPKRNGELKSPSAAGSVTASSPR